MSEDFQAIQTLAQQWRQHVENAPKIQLPFGDAITIIDIVGGPLRSQGDKVLHLLEEELKQNPSDHEVRLELCKTMTRMGDVYYDAVSVHLLTMTPEEFRGIEVSSDTYDQLYMIRLNTPHYAQSACARYHDAMAIMPNTPAAQRLADIFRIVGFNGTALHWNNVALEIATQVGNSELVNRLKAQRLDMKAGGNTTDPPLPKSDGRTDVFPTRDTAGLQLDFQVQAEEAARQAEEGARQAEAQAARQRQEEQERQRQQAEAERQRRVGAGLCVNCGKPLGFMDKLSGKQAHGRC